MSSAAPRDRTELDRECRVFTRHLLGCDPDAYVADRYASAHAALPALTAAEPFERALVAVARVAPAFTRIADAYSGILSRRAVLRAKLVLLLAILETRPPFGAMIDRRPGSGLALLAACAGTTLAAAAGFVVGIVVFLPVRVAVALARRGRR